MDMMIKQYFKTMGTCQFTLASLGNAITDREMICLCLVQFTKNDDNYLKLIHIYCSGAAFVFVNFV